MYKDIGGNILEVGDIVYYARKRDYTANGELVKYIVTKLTDKYVGLELCEPPKYYPPKYKSTQPNSQLIKLK